MSDRSISTELPLLDERREPLDKAILTTLGFVMAYQNVLATLVSDKKISREEYLAYTLQMQRDSITLMSGGSVGIMKIDENNRGAELGLEAISSILDKVLEKQKERKNAIVQ